MCIYEFLKKNVGFAFDHDFWLSTVNAYHIHRGIMIKDLFKFLERLTKTVGVVSTITANTHRQTEEHQATASEQ